MHISGKMAETNTSSSGLSSASVGLSCESSSDATSSSVVNVLEQLKVPRLVLWVCNCADGLPNLVLSVFVLHVCVLVHTELHYNPD